MKLQTGDLICFTKDLSVDEETRFKLKEVECPVKTRSKTRVQATKGDQDDQEADDNKKDEAPKRRKKLMIYVVDKAENEEDSCKQPITQVSEILMDTDPCQRHKQELAARMTEVNIFFTSFI